MHQGVAGMQGGFIMILFLERFPNILSADNLWLLCAGPHPRKILRNPISDASSHLQGSLIRIFSNKLLSAGVNHHTNFLLLSLDWCFL